MIKFAVMEEDVDKRESLPQNFPQVKFEIDLNLDVWKISNFWADDGSRRRGSADFRQRLVKAHPTLGGLGTLSPPQRDAKIRTYIQDYYHEHADKFSTAASGISQEWDRYAQQFFEATGKIFRGLVWPSGKYMGFVSICPPFPRFLHDKTFQVPDGSAERCIRVAAHEMLHFLFYEYVRQRYVFRMVNTVERDMDREMKGRLTIPLWELSEIFNFAVLTPENFGEGGQADSQVQYRFYQHLDPYVPTFERVWREAEQDVSKLFDRLEVDAR